MDAGVGRDACACSVQGLWLWRQYYWALDPLVCCSAHCCHRHFETQHYDPHPWSTGLPKSQTRCHLYPNILVSFRRLLRQEGAFLHQRAAEPKSVTWWISKLHVQLQVQFPVCCGAQGRCSLCADQVGIQRILPLDYSAMHLPPLVGVAVTNENRSTQLAVLPLSNPIVAALKEMEISASSTQCNVEVSLVSCSCGDFHVSLVATADLCHGDVLVPMNSCPPRILVQFDRSAHRLSQKGGAGAALLQVECTGVSLLDWGARALPNCADNIVAETHGADLPMCLREKYLYMCQQQGLPPLPLDRIQGDIKPLIQHLDFRGRFRLNDLVPLIDQFHAKRSRIAPGSITEYRPREANAMW